MIYLRFSGGKAKALTLSYDDGVKQDVKLLKIMKEKGLKGTFNLNSESYASLSWAPVLHHRLTKKECIELFKDSGMEVALHGCTHPYMDRLTGERLVYEIFQDRKNLEKDYGMQVRGCAYPFGTFNDDVISVLKSCGIKYSRTVTATHNFELPVDWFRLNPTCHHADPSLEKLCDNFLKGTPVRTPWMFYLWGHSYEFDDSNNWEIIEEFANKMANKDDIWYATNIEIYRYVEAFNCLEFSLDETSVYNPSAVSVWFIPHENADVIEVKPGETIHLI